MQATNAGGTGVNRTGALPAIKAAPTPEPEPKFEPKPTPGGGSAGSPPPTPQTSAGAETAEVSLAGERIVVRGGGVALVRLACSGGTEDCSGRITLTAKDTEGRSARKRSRAVTIGVAKFTVAPGATTAVKIDLNPTGRTLLGADHGQLAASLTLVELEPEASRPQTESVHLVLTSDTRKARRRKQK